MAVPEFKGWAGFLSREPPGDIRTQLLLAQLLAFAHNWTQRKGSRPKRPIDFMPWLKADPGPSKSELKQIDANKAQVAEMRKRLLAQRSELK